MSDSIMREVRENRHALEKEWGGSLEQIHEHLWQLQKEFESRIVSFADLRPPSGRFAEPRETTERSE